MICRAWLDAAHEARLAYDRAVARYAEGRGDAEAVCVAAEAWAQAFKRLSAEERRLFYRERDGVTVCPRVPWLS